MNEPFQSFASFHSVFAVGGVFSEIHQMNPLTVRYAEPVHGGLGDLMFFWRAFFSGKPESETRFRFQLPNSSRRVRWIRLIHPVGMSTNRIAQRSEIYFLLGTHIPLVHHACLSEFVKCGSDMKRKQRCLGYRIGFFSVKHL